MNKHADGYDEFRAAVAEASTARPDDEAQVQVRFISALMPAAIETANELHKAGFEASKIINGLAIAMGFVLASSVGSVVKEPKQAIRKLLPIHNAAARHVARGHPR